MLKPLFYDFKRTLTSKAVIIIICLAVLFSLSIITLISSSTLSFSSNNTNTPVLLYYDSSGYHFLVYSANQYGQPISGVAVQFNLTNGNNNYLKSGTTNSSGYSFITINAPINNSYSVSEKITVPDGLSTPPFGGIAIRFYPPTGGLTQNLSSGQVVTPFENGPGFSAAFYPVVDASNSSKRNVQVFFSGSYGARPSYSVYYKAYNVSAVKGGQPPPLYFNQTQMQLLGSLNGFRQTFSLNLPKNDTCTSVSQVTSFGGGQVVTSSCNIQVYFELFAQNGTLVQTSQISSQELVPSPGSSFNPSNVATQFFGSIMGFFIPLVAIIGSYSSYGKDRVTGVLESVLSRPVSRKGLAVSRYLSAFAALSVAIIISVIVVDVLLRIFGGSFLDPTLLLAAIGAFLVDLGAFLGLMFLFSHLFRSTGALIGIGIGLFVVLYFFWTLIEFAIALALGATINSAVFLQVSILANLFNPAQFISLVFTYITGQSALTAIQPSAYGLTIPTLVADGLLWIILPFFLFYYRAIKKD